MPDPFKPAKRRVLKALGVGVPATAAVFAGAQAPSAAPGQAPSPASSPTSSAAIPPGVAGASKADSATLVSHFFNIEERTAVDAIVARLIPADDLGPGAKEAGVTIFLDRQLAGAFGAGANFYRQGPFQPGTPEQGYQLSLTPAECFRLGLASLDHACTAKYGGKRFAQLDTATQDVVLAGLQTGNFAIEALPGPLFFQMLLDGAIEGFFSDPVYGGNRDMVSWKLLGFPGAMASFANDIERHNVAYVRAPVSIATARPHEMKVSAAAPDGTTKTAPVIFMASANDDVCRSPISVDGVPREGVR